MVARNSFAGGVGVLCRESGPLRIEQNSFAGNRVGLVSSDSAPRIARNFFADSGIALQFSGPKVPDRVELNAVQAAGLLLENQTAGAVGATNNWWGETDEGRIAARMRGAVDWRPFLQSDPRSLPAALELRQNYPNPFNGSTSIRFAIGVDEALRARGRTASLMVRNSAGQVVRRLWQQPASPGAFTAVWDGTDEGGQPVASGVYYCQVEVGDLHLARQMLLLK
ncbi:MAG: hypothetical protein FJY95_20270 [Candidatus Handelsmanbacteria bacterium]|nr:hypothetical protein [Candidatus Handelsmanbacteria bacterium]